MSKVLIVAEHDWAASSTPPPPSASPPRRRCRPNPSTSSCWPPIPPAVAAEAAQIAGVAKVLTVANAANANAIAQVLAPQVAALASGYSHVFGPAPPSART
jgi:electron transfer flavoprotein alpha subunit